MIRVLVADDHQAVREGVRALLAAEREITVVGEAGDGSTALAMARTLRPDLIVLDDSMPGQSGLDVARKITHELPSTAIVFLARDPGMRDLALAAGATAFIPKDAPSEELLRAVRAGASVLTARQQLGALRPEGRRVVELLLGSRVMNEAQVQEAIAQRATGESLATTLVRLGLIGQPELADILARASDTPLVSLAPYPEIAAPIDPTESRLSSPRLVDPVDRDAARLLPMDIARGLGVVITASGEGQGVLAMADPLDEVVFAEAERYSRLRLTRVTATADDIKDTLDRVWNGGGSRHVIWTGSLLSQIYTSSVLLVIVAASLGGFFFATREAFAPRFGLSLFALMCGIFFFLYAFKYYVTIASVILITLFGDPAKFQGRNGHTNGNGHANGNGLKADGQTTGNGQSNGQHKEGYRTLRGENLSEGGSVQVTDPWQKMGEIRLPADKQPFVSVQLALYNEKRVVDRLLTACTSFDYENYEVIVVDDSTDETVELLKRWKDHPRVRVIHRQSRKGFKGGALQEALRRMNPRAEYVMIFDADFVPPADAIWHFLDYFGRLAKAKNGNGNGHAKNGNGHGAPQNGDRLAVVQGYQWHMLNASENWITKGVRAEFAGSYVLERAGQELFGAMKMISGSVYMIRADVLRKLGWSTSITEDWELTIRLYLAGYKVLYTPYIQAPAECVSKVNRLIKQRMRWAEGHTYNVKKYVWQILRSPNLTWQEKLEFAYYAPYYLQSVLYTFATLSWIVGVLVLGQKLPMWGEVFGWSLVVTNALALPLMNLTGVLLEGSLKRDALGVLSFIGLSWVLVPFQAYASIKAIFEKKEGGWVRTPKSGHVTEALERFHLARLMPWELPRRRRGQAKTSSGGGRFAAAAAVVLAAAGIITVGALSIRAAATSGATSDDLALPALVGTAVPLAILGLGWLRLRRRVTAIVLAFTLGLGTNVVFVAHAVPAAAVSDNTSTFTFRNTTGFNTPNKDMVQNYTPAGGGTTCPSTSGHYWTCAFASDTFTTGQALSAGTAQTTLYLRNSTPLPTLRTSYGTSCAPGCSGIGLYRPPGTVDNDVMIAIVSVSPKKGITAPAGWTLIASLSNGTAVTTAAYWKVAASGDPASWSWTWGGNTSTEGIILSYTSVDTSSPIDAFASGTDASGTSHTAPSVTTTSANDLVITAYGLDALATWTPPAGMNELFDNGYAGGSGSLEVNDMVKATGGSTGSFVATSSVAGAGANITIALRQGAGGTCNVKVELSYVPASTAAPVFVAAGTDVSATFDTTLVIPVPAGTAQDDVMIASIGYQYSYETLTPPAGWTLLRQIYNNDVSSYYGKNALAVYWRVAGSSEPASYAWTINGHEYAGSIQSFRGVNTTTPIDIEAGQTQPTGTSFATPSITTTLPNVLLVATHTFASADTWTPPSGMTETVDIASDPVPNTFSQSIEESYVVQSAIGSTGAKTATTNSGASYADLGNTHLFALVPSAITTLGSGTASIANTGSVTAVTTNFATTGVTFGTGDRLVLKVTAPEDANNCNVQLSYDGASVASRLVTATIVPEGVVGLLLLAPALPLAARWWKRRRP